jgi:3-deoxy-D-manno-octulosonic-acid transferase
MQNELYADRVRQLGAVNVSVEGTMKWDNASTTNEIEGAEELAQDLQIDSEKPLIVAGSTALGEHELLKQSLPNGVQLLCAPRRPEWFDEAEKTFPSCNRRTKTERTTTSFFLLDTIGELDKAYSLADVVVIGRSFAPLHGSDPTQPIALGKPTIIGPNASDFEEMVQLLLQGKGIVQCEASELAEHLKTILGDAALRKSLSESGRKVIVSQQGATKRYEKLIMDHTPHA